MPKRTDLKSILIIGSGPIVIGQGAEFDYSGTQACRALREEGYRVVLVNSNPATIMTDPQFADATYIEPITPGAVEKILKREKEHGTPVDAVLPTLGGQTGLNTAMACWDQGIFAKYGVEMIGANREAIWRGEDRQAFKDLMIQIGLKVPASRVVHTMDEAREVVEEIGLPLIIRPAFTLGGTGGGIAYNRDEFEEIVSRGLDASPISEVLIEQSVIGWKEFELEVMRDRADNAIVVCSIENFDPMGVHTGDSITVAPIQTLTDKEYQRMRDAALAIIRAVGVETGGSNIQFAVNPADGEMVVVEMNPRVSRSSALASKATGFPIAKIAAKLAVGYTLDELPNDITKKTVACFEPTIDYVVVKMPRWTFEKFPEADETLTTQMKSVGEAMAIGRTFKEALQKAIRSMEVGRFGLGLDKNDKWLASVSTRGFQPLASSSGRSDEGGGQRLEASATGAFGASRGTAGVSPALAQGGSGTSETPALRASARETKVIPEAGEAAETWPIPEEKLRRKLAVPSQGRMYYIRYALKMGWSVEQVHELTKIDPWFLHQIRVLVEFEGRICSALNIASEALTTSNRYGQAVLDLIATSTAGTFVEAIRASESRENRPKAEQATLAADRLREAVSHLAALLEDAKQLGYSDVQLANALGLRASDVRSLRAECETSPVYKLVDTCAAEFEAATPYYYSTYEQPFEIVGKGQGTTDKGQTVDDEIRITDRPKVIIIGGGPNRIGQGIEFDYCCVQAAYAMRELGYESVMINSNPETVSTDYDTSDLLFFEPLTHEDVLNICERLNGGPFARESDDATKRRSDEGAGAARFSGTSTFDLGRSTLDVQSEPSVASSLRRSVASGLVHGVIVQFGGQTPLNLARGLEEAGVPILGTSVAAIHRAGSREQFRELIQQLGLRQPPNGIARNLDEARKIAADVGYPVLVRPSFVLGGRAMEIVYDEPALNRYMTAALAAAGLTGIADSPILIDKFLDNATEVDVDCVADYEPSGTASPGAEPSPRGAAEEKPWKGSTPELSRAQTDPATASPRSQTRSGEAVPRGRSVIAGVMEHIEEAGIHSGDSACVLPPYSLLPDVVAELKRQTHELARALRVRGLMNVQYAVKDGEIYVIEVNPRASRTIPFVGKATGIPWANIAAKVMAGKSLDGLDVHEPPAMNHVAVKEAVFPFAKFPGVDIILGPEMRSTGEVMGIDASFEVAYAKAQIAEGTDIPLEGTLFISVRDADKPLVIPIAREFARLGFTLISTSGTHAALTKAGLEATLIPKIAERARPNLIDYIKNGQVQLILNTPTKKGAGTDEAKIRAVAFRSRVPIVTTITGGMAYARAIEALRKGDWEVRPLQDYHARAAPESKTAAR